MPLNGFNCKIPDRILRNEKNKPFSANELTEVGKRVKQLKERLLATRRAVPGEISEAADNFAELSAQRWENVMKLVDGESLKPGSNRNLIKWLEFKMAEQFAVWRDLGGLGDGISEAGGVRQELIRAGRQYRGALDDTLAEIAAADIIGRAQKEIQPILKKAGFSKRDADALMLDIQEVGWHRYADTQFNVSEAGRALLKHKQQKLYSELAGKMSKEEMEKVVKAGKDIADVYNKTLDVVRASGLNVGDASELIGYSPRLFTDETLKRLSWFFKDTADEAKAVVFKSGEQADIKDVFQKSRNTNDFVVEDMVLLDFVLRRNDPDIYKKIGVEDVKGILDDGGLKLGDALFNHLGSDVVDALVDSGLVSKIPMTSREVFNYMVKKYELPFEGLSELMLTDPVRAFKQYTTQLESLSAASGRTWLLLKNSMQGGWGVSSAVRKAEPAKYKDFVSLDSVIPDNLKKRFGMSDDELTGIMGGKSSELFNTLKDTYAHPVAANMYKAILQVSSNPNQMGFLASVFSGINKTFRSLVLTTTGTVQRIVWSNAFQVTAAGGSIFEYGKQVAKWLPMVAMHKGVITEDTLKRFFNDSDKVFKGLNGELITEKELYRQAVRAGFLNDIGSLTADSSKNAVRGRNYFNRAAGYIGDAAAKYGWLSGRTFSDVADFTGYIVNDRVSLPFRMANNILDNAAKFSLLKTLSSSKFQPGQFMTAFNTKNFDNLAEAMEHTSDYFFWYDDLGKMDKFLGKYVVPFWTYMSRNPVAQVRSAMRNPARFMAYHRLYAAMNSPASGEGEDLPRGGLADYQQGQRNIYWVIPEELSGTGKREYFAINMGGVDPIGDGLDFAGDVGNAALSMFGVKQTKHGAKERLGERADWMKTETNNVLYKYLTGSPDNMFNAFPLVQAIAQTVINRDAYGNILYGEDDKVGTKVPKSFLGYEVSPLAKMWFEKMLPPLALLDRTNPGNIFGSPEITDGKGNVEVQAGASRMPALPGLKPGAERSRSSNRDISQAQIDRTRGKNDGIFNFRTLVNSGVNVTYLDVAKQMGFTESDMRRALKEGQSTIPKMRNALRDIPPEKQQAQLQRIEEYKAQWYRLQQDYQAVVRWRKQRGIPDYGQKMENTRQGRIYDPVADMKLMDEVEKW